jgi:hypothetical protein
VDDHAVLPGDSVAIAVNRSADRLDVHYSLRPSTLPIPGREPPSRPVSPRPGR